MNSYPLIRTKWSNERIMAIVFLAAVLYMLPGFINDPGNILNFTAVLALSLVTDTMANYIRYKRPVCAVSAAVTAGVLYALSAGTPLWQQLVAVTVALIAGKHIWGGTGRNPVNPAIFGLLFLSVFFRVNTPAFSPSWLLLPAVVVSLPFIVIRPFAAIGTMAGMVLSLLLRQSFSLANTLSYGVLFWGCLVMTDPVTVTANPFAGALAGLLAGFLPLYLGGSASAMAIGILSANIFSFAADALLSGGLSFRVHFKDSERVAFSDKDTLYDMTEERDEKHIEIDGLSKEDILERIERNGVFGFGGAAFPTAKKIRAAMEANAGERHLIVNGVECDPGLIHDKWLLRNRTGDIACGVRLLKKCIPFTSVTVAVKHTEDISFPDDIALCRVPDFYPAGAEKTLIKEVLKRALPHDSIPANEGILVLNVQTVAAIYKAVSLDRKADTRLITLADVGAMSGRIARVRMGANIHNAAESLFPGAACVFGGGGIMNAHMAADDAVVDEKINFIAVGIPPVYRESPLCSKCGYCSAVCPSRLKVNEIARLADAGRYGQTAKLHPERCVACGSCSRVCLAGRNLAARVTKAKESLKAAVSGEASEN